MKTNANNEAAYEIEIEKIHKAEHCTYLSAEVYHLSSLVLAAARANPDIGITAPSTTYRYATIARKDNYTGKNVHTVHTGPNAEAALAAAIKAVR